MRSSLFPLAAFVSAAPATSIPPPPIETYTYYGPVRHCGLGFAIDAREGEGLSVNGRSAYVQSGVQSFVVSRELPINLASLGGLIKPAGALDVQGVGRFKRLRTSSGPGSKERLAYRLDLADSNLFSQLQATSDQFTGGEADAAILRRVAVGAEAAQICADVPKALHATAERQNEDAFWLRPTRFAGPLTICFDKLALDVRQSEAAYLPWRNDVQRYAVLTETMEVGIAGSFNEDSHGPAPPEGPLAAELRYRITSGASAGMESIIPTFMRAEVPATNRARLVAVADQKRIGPDPGPGLSFSFSRPLSDTERNAFISRVRGQTVADRCFNPEMKRPNST